MINRGAGQREQHADDLGSMDGFLARDEREQQHHERRERHDQRKIDRRGRNTGDIDRAAANEHAEETGQDDAGRLPPQHAGLFPQAPSRPPAAGRAPRCSSEKTRSRTAERLPATPRARIMLETCAVGDQQEAEQAQHFARSADGFLGWLMPDPMPAERYDVRYAAAYRLAITASNAFPMAATGGFSPVPYPVEQRTQAGRIGACDFDQLIMAANAECLAGRSCMAGAADCRDRRADQADQIFGTLRDQGTAFVGGQRSAATCPPFLSMGKLPSSP